VLKGIITIRDDVLYSCSLMYRELVVSVVNDAEDFENVCWGIKLIEEADPEYQSMAVREFLVDRLQEVLHLDRLLISKSSGGIPVVLKGGNELPVAVSLSHHDGLVGYSFQLGDLL
jgi:hypothetical protein